MAPRDRIALLAALVLVVAAVITGCPQQTGTPSSVPSPQEFAGLQPEPGKPSVDPGSVEIAVITNTVSPFWTAVEAGVERAAADLGCKAYLVGCKSGQLEEQRRLLENAEAKGVAGIAVSPLDTKALSTVIDQIVDRGTPVVCIDSDCPGSARHCYVGSDNYAGGQMLGEYANEVLKQGAKCAIFVGEAGVENSKARIEGFKKTVAEKGIEVLDVMQDHSVTGRARSNVEDIIQKYPDIDALVGIWSYNLPAIAAAVTEQGKHDTIKVIGFDAEPTTLGALEAEQIDATVVQNPYGFGYQSVQILYGLAVDDEAKLAELVPRDKVVDTGVELVTPDNLAAFKQKLAERGIESS